MEGEREDARFRLWVTALVFLVDSVMIAFLLFVSEPELALPAALHFSCYIVLFLIAVFSLIGLIIGISLYHSESHTLIRIARYLISILNYLMYLNAMLLMVGAIMVTVRRLKG